MLQIFFVTRQNQGNYTLPWHFHHQSHHNLVLFLLWLHLSIHSGVISSLFSSSILGTYWPGKFIFQCMIFWFFHTVHGVLKAKILKWFAIAFSNGTRFVRTLHQDLSLDSKPQRPEHQENRQEENIVSTLTRLKSQHQQGSDPGSLLIGRIQCLVISRLRSQISYWLTVGESLLSPRGRSQVPATWPFHNANILLPSWLEILI